MVWTSPLRRGADVGCWLARWGWRHHVDARLSELDFGDWDGRPWDAIGEPQLTAWTASFAEHAAGGGESVAQLMARCRTFIDERRHLGGCIVGHAGWINAALRVRDGLPAPSAAAEWPTAIRYAASLDLSFKAAGAASQ